MRIKTTIILALSLAVFAAGGFAKDKNKADGHEKAGKATKQSMKKAGDGAETGMRKAGKGR